MSKETITIKKSSMNEPTADPTKTINNDPYPSKKRVYKPPGTSMNILAKESVAEHTKASNAILNKIRLFFFTTRFFAIRAVGVISKKARRMSAMVHRGKLCPRGLKKYPDNNTA